MSKESKSPIFMAVIAISAFLVAGSLVVGFNDQIVFAYKKTDSAVQGLSQEEYSAQSSSVLSENGTSTASGNNLDFSLNLNDGQNALGQQ